jgi:hypothetical protein
MTGAASPQSRDLLRHAVATLAYRAEKVLRDVPDGFADYQMSETSRTPFEILCHMGDLMTWAENLARGEYKWTPEASPDWDAACDRFFTSLAAFDAALVDSPLEKFSAGIIFQGPVADALTHVGQLALIRGSSGAPVKPESYARAEIQLGRVGRDQSTVRKEFEGDASKRRK